MKVFYCVDHDSFWPVGCASVVIAENEEKARELLDKALLDKGLKLGLYGLHDDEDYEPYTLVPMKANQAVILNDGNY